MTIGARTMAAGAERMARAWWASPEERERRIDYHLQNWADWSRSGGLGLLRCGTHRLGGAPADWEDMTRSCDRRTAMDVDRIVRSMAPAQAAALSHRYLEAVYRFNRCTYDAALASARDTLAAGLARAGVW